MTIDKGIIIKNVYYMLTYAFSQLRANNYEDIAGEDFDEIYDLFAEILLKGVSFQLKQGLHKEYVETHESLTTLRGKPDINVTMRNFASNRRILECEFDIFTENNLFNSILKTTMRFLLRASGVKKSRKVALQRLLLFFDGVSEVNPRQIKWNSLRYDRNSKTYQLLHYLCHFILGSLLLSTEPGKFKMKSFTDERMNILFQNFVLNYYRRHHPTTHAGAKQIEWNIDKSQSHTSHLPILQSDILLHLEERTLIIDTKYYSSILNEHFGKKILHSANVHQIHTYVMNYDVGHKGNVDGMLLYAKTEEETVPDDRIVLNDGNILFVKTLDLNSRFDKICKQLDDLIG